MGTVVEVGGVSRIEEDRLLVICKARAAIQLKDEPERTLLGYGSTTLQCFSLSAPLFISSLFKERCASASASAAASPSSSVPAYVRFFSLGLHLPHVSWR